MLEQLKEWLMVMLFKLYVKVDSLERRFKRLLQGPSQVEEVLPGVLRVTYAPGESVFLPFNKGKRLNMSNYSVMLNYEGNKLLDVTHNLAAPYAFTAKELGGTKYVVVTRDSKQTIVAEMKEAPGYLDKFISEDD